MFPWHLNNEKYWNKLQLDPFNCEEIWMMYRITVFTHAYKMSQTLILSNLIYLLQPQDKPNFARFLISFVNTCTLCKLKIVVMFK